MIIYLYLLYYKGVVQTFLHNSFTAHGTSLLTCYICSKKVKSCYNPLRLGTVIVLVSSGRLCKYSTFI